MADDPYNWGPEDDDLMASPLSCGDNNEVVLPPELMEEEDDYDNDYEEGDVAAETTSDDDYDGNTPTRGPTEPLVGPSWSYFFVG